MIKDKNNMSYKDFLMLQETERSRIAEDLHDTTVCLLYTSDAADEL